MNILVRQPGGLGDIFFIQKLCKVLAQDHEVYHPVTHQMWNAGADQLETGKVHCGVNLPIPNDSAVYDCSEQYTLAPGRGKDEVMTSKYDGANIDWTDWRDYFKYKRLPEREQALKNQLEIKDGEPFILCNKLYGFQKWHNGVGLTLPENYDGKIIWMHPSMTQKLFDWCWLLENAEQIHLVETSINYLIDTLDVKATKLVAHPRHWKNTEPCVGKLFNQPWQWVEYEREFWRQMVPEELE